MSNGKLSTPQPVFVIIEQIYNKSIPGLPGAAAPVGPELRQVVRRVAQVHADQDIFFEGKKLKGMPSTMQSLKELILPGKQITTRPTGGKSLVLVYAGFTNLLTPLQQMNNLLPEVLTKERTLPTWTGGLFRMGTDPVPNIVLQGNQSVSFSMQGGNGVPTAIAIYDRRLNKLEIPSPDMRTQAIRQLVNAR